MDGCAPAALMSASSIIVATDAIVLKRVEPRLRGPVRLTGPVVELLDSASRIQLAHVPLADEMLDRVRTRRGEARVEGLDDQIRAAVADVNITLDRYGHLLPGLGPGRARADQQVPG
jgi:hypothetical protein